MGHKKHKLEYAPVIEDTDDVPIEFANLDRKLNRKQRNFIWLAVNNPRLSLVECASKAGYKDPRQRAYALFKNPEVRKEYNFLQNELKKKYELNYDRAVQDLYTIRDKALENGSYNAAVAAQGMLLKVGGLVVDRKEVKYGTIDQMSREEVEKRLAQLLGQTIEVKPEDPSLDNQQSDNAD